MAFLKSHLRFASRRIFILSPKSAFNFFTVSISESISNIPETLINVLLDGEYERTILLDIDSIDIDLNQLFDYINNNNYQAILFTKEDYDRCDINIIQFKKKILIKRKDGTCN